MLDHTVRHVVANWRANPAIEACSRRSCSTTQRHALVVSIARGLATKSSCSANTRTGHDGSTRDQVRLRHNSTVGAPKQGVSTRRTVRRLPWEPATTPHEGQPITEGSDSTVTCNPPGSRFTPTTCRPGRPTNRSQRSQ